MDFLTKFQSLQIKTDNRITETDRQFCEAHYRAYTAALSCFQELKYMWSDISGKQIDLLAAVDSELNRSSIYLYSDDFSLSITGIDKHIKSLHQTFIETLVHYFNNFYHMSVSSSEIVEHLLPKEPDHKGHYFDTEKTVAYEEQMLNLILSYQDILEQIFSRLDGRTFKEQALHELREHCSAAAWNTSLIEARYEISKNVIRFAYNACFYKDLYRAPWEINDRIKTVLSGIAHFETSDFSLLPSGISMLVKYRSSETDYVAFPTCQKVRSLKMFKNGRVDIKFASESFAKQFANEYLGLIS